VPFGVATLLPLILQQTWFVGKMPDENTVKMASGVVTRFESKLLSKNRPIRFEIM